MISLFYKPLYILHALSGPYKQNFKYICCEFQWFFMKYSRFHQISLLTRQPLVYGVAAPVFLTLPSSAH